MVTVGIWMANGQLERSVMTGESSPCRCDTRNPTGPLYANGAIQRQLARHYRKRNRGWRVWCETKPISVRGEEQTDDAANTVAIGANRAKQSQFQGLVQFRPPCGHSPGVGRLAPAKGSQTRCIRWRRHPADAAWAGSPCHFCPFHPRRLFTWN